MAIIAVFGGNDATPPELATARALGSAVARAGATVLTGGVGGAADEVKEQAIEGAVAAGGRWVGVANGPRPAPPRPTRGGVVLHPGIGHRRNYLTAALCDAAVVLAGDDGTASELLFALALRRPVALVGRRVVAVSELRSQAARRVPPPVRPRTPLDHAICAAYTAVLPDPPGPMPLAASAGGIVRALLSTLSRPAARTAAGRCPPSP